MGSKHTQLTRNELENHNLSWPIEDLIMDYVERTSIPAKSLKVLDWGCGRGKSVIKLLSMGFKAKGVDIDQKVLDNGGPVLRELGYDPSAVLLHKSQLPDLEEHQFDIIFSEQVVEHVEDLKDSMEQMARLIKKGGLMVHLFPGTTNIVESHLKMPFIHWLPKNKMRKIAIGLFVFMGIKPTPPWPGTLAMTFAQEVNAYYQYLNKKTYYRDIKSVMKSFEEYDLYPYNGIPEINPAINQNYFRRNGFPNQHIKIVLEKNI